MSRGRLARFVVGLAGCAALFCEPSVAHQAVDPAILRLIKPRTGPDPGTIQRPVGDPLVERGRTLFFSETFGGNGRTCGTCHRANRNLTIDAEFIRRLPESDPLFVAETNPDLKGLENPKLMRQFGLILENLDGFGQPGVLRGVPHTLGLRFTTGPANGVDLDGATGWSGDGAPGDKPGQRGTLLQFAVGAVVQHFTKSMDRTAGVDFVVPTQDQLDALLAFQLSLGRQGNMVVDPHPGVVGAIAFQDSNVTKGQELFHGIGASRACSGCHAGGGAVTPGGAGINADTGVRRLPNAPACLDSTVPGDGGLGASPSTTETLCGHDVEFRGNGTFNTPSIIEAADTPPFFHNNAVATLESAVGFYTSPTFNASPAGAFGAFDLDASEVNQVAAFLRALNAVDNIDNAQRSLKDASGRPSLLRLLRDPAVVDINDAARVLSNGPLRPSAGAVPWLRAAVVNIARGRIAQAQGNLATARSFIVISPPP